MAVTKNHKKTNEEKNQINSFSNNQIKTKQNSKNKLYTGFEQI